MVTITCEGELTYLLDSIQRPRTISGSVNVYIEQLLKVHNEQVEPKKRIEIGYINVAGTDMDIERTISAYTSTLALLRELPEKYGGYLRIQNRNGKKYLDYVWDYGGINSQTIRFGENLLDLNKYVDASGIITCLIPLGGEMEYQDELGETQTKTVNITSVNEGKDYITADQEILERYGRIWGTQKFEEITSPKLLLEKAQEYLKEAAVLPETIEISAVDLSDIGMAIERFQIGYWTNVVSSPHGINQRYMLSQRTLNLLDPTQGSITLGRETSTLTESINKNQVTVSDRIDKLQESTSEEINRKIDNATTLITGGFGGYVILDNIDPATGKKMHPWRILIMNTPDKDTAKNVIQINQNGIGFSTTGINGPYSNAWTIDGNLVADFVTTGTMLADRIRGGTLEVGGPGLGKAGVIRVLDENGTELMRMSLTGIVINSGKLKAPEIVGGHATFADGLFEANEDMVYIGGFMATYDWGRDIFQSFDEQCGMSADPNKKADFGSGLDGEMKKPMILQLIMTDCVLRMTLSAWAGRASGKAGV
ncbi:MAG: phage tail spike protein [Hungatella sp.]